jgi:hypothetical protein
MQATDGTATATATGNLVPVTYLWSNGANNRKASAGLTAGTYTVTVTETPTCTAVASLHRYRTYFVRCSLQQNRCHHHWR